MKTLDRALWKALKAYLLIDRKHSDKPSAVSANKSRFFKLADYFSDKDFNRENFNNFIAEMKAKNYSLSYLNNMIKICKHVSKYLGVKGFDDYSYFKERRRIVRVILTPSEIERIANVRLPYKRYADFINQRQQALILLMGTTGARIGEILSLTFDDVGDNPPHVVFRDTKSNEDRIVPIGKQIHKLLLSLPRKSKYIFTSGRGGILESQQVNTDLKARGKAVGVEKDITCHLFRASYITQMLEDGVDWLDLSVVIGHKDPRVTLRYKQSLLGHYVNVISRHPLLVEEITYDQAIEQVKQALQKIKDSKNLDLEINESKEGLLIKIEKKAEN